MHDNGLEGGKPTQKTPQQKPKPKRDNSLIIRNCCSMPDNTCIAHMECSITVFERCT